MARARAALAASAAISAPESQGSFGDFRLAIDALGRLARVQR